MSKVVAEELPPTLSVLPGLVIVSPPHPVQVPVTVRLVRFIEPLASPAVPLPTATQLAVEVQRERAVSIAEAVGSLPDDQPNGYAAPIAAALL